TAEEKARYVLADGGDGAVTVEPRTNYFVARAERLMRDGETQLGAIATAVNRDLTTGSLRTSLRSSAYTGGLDFSHEFLHRAWRVHGYFAFSHIAGDELAIVRAQRSSARYYQRPDADHLTLDSTRTML